MWRATLDGRTRHAHRLLDGQMVDIGEKFKVDGYELEYPGDPSEVPKGPIFLYFILQVKR